MNFSKINELKPYDLNCNIFDVYSYNGLSMQELLCQFFTKINECVKTSNETIDLAEWLVNEGLKQEVAIKLTTWLNDGTLENLINVTLFENLNKKIDNVTSQLEHIVYYVSPSNVDDTDMLQEAFNKYNYIVLNKGVYNIDAVKKIRINSNKTIEFKNGAVLKVKPNNSESYRALDLFACENVTLINPVIVGDKDEHDFSSGGTHEFGHGNYLSTTKNVKIINPKCSKLTGDGISIYHSENTLIENCEISDCRRQGISVVSSINLHIIGGVISNIKGTAPECGIDLEPNDSTGILKNITIKNLKTIECANGGILLTPQQIKGDNDNKIIAITIENHIDEGSAHGLVVSQLEPSEQLSGFINVLNCSYINSKEQAVYITSYANEYSVPLRIVNPLIKNCNTKNISPSFPQYSSGIVVERTNVLTGVKPIGNILIENPFIVDNRGNKLMTNGFYFSDLKNKNFENFIIKNPTVNGIAIEKAVNFRTSKGIKIIDDFNNLTMNVEQQYSTLNNNGITKFTNNNLTTIAQINISNTYNSDSIVTFENSTDKGMIIVSPANMNILPLSKINGKYIMTTEKGSSVKIRRLDDSSYIIENIVGNWTAGE